MKSLIRVAALITVFGLISPYAQAKNESGSQRIARLLTAGAVGCYSAKKALYYSISRGWATVKDKMAEVGQKHNGPILQSNQQTKVYYSIKSDCSTVKTNVVKVEQKYNGGILGSGQQMEVLTTVRPITRLLVRPLFATVFGGYAGYTMVNECLRALIEAYNQSAKD